MIAFLYFLCHFFLQILQTSAKVPAIIVFGDSSVDSGNNNHISTVVKSNFQPYGRDFYGGKATGRFSNGRVASDFISEEFGIKPMIPAYLDLAFNITDFSTGVCFASGGSGYDNSTSNLLVSHRQACKRIIRLQAFQNTKSYPFILSTGYSCSFLF